MKSSQTEVDSAHHFDQAETSSLLVLALFSSLRAFFFFFIDQTCINLTVLAIILNVESALFMSCAVFPILINLDFFHYVKKQP